MGYKENNINLKTEGNAKQRDELQTLPACHFDTPKTLVIGSAFSVRLYVAKKSDCYPSQ